MPMEESVEKEEAGKDVDVGEVPPTEESVPEQAPALPATLLAASRMWAGGPGDQVARQGPPVSLRARGKAPTIHAE